MKEWDRCAVTTTMRAFGEIPVEKAKQEVLDEIKRSGEKIKEIEWGIEQSKEHFYSIVKCFYDIEKW